MARGFVASGGRTGLGGHQVGGCDAGQRTFSTDSRVNRYLALKSSGATARSIRRIEGFVRDQAFVGKSTPLIADERDECGSGKEDDGCGSG